ncbi:hypothetical protein PG993_004214 [Apiospora rasikravindrae]|uniref:Uncharacterized protein n=1 Tax=Apiospora rasikravindrae TaxID=990691 RepID=A0ABR1TC37_9PEZI
MKYATAAAAVLPLAWASNLELRGNDTKYNISKLEASCDSDDKCSYNMQIATGDDSDSTSCSLKSVMKLGAAPESECGPYTVSAVKPHDGGINFLVGQSKKGLKGVFTVYPKDMKKTESDDGEVLSYKGGDAFDVSAKASGPAKSDDDDEAPKVSTIMSHAAMDPPQATSKLSSIMSVGAPQDLPTAAPTGTLKVASSAAPTAASGASGASTMVTATATGSSSSPSSTAASDDDSSSSSGSSSSDSSSSGSSSSGSSSSGSSGSETSSSDSSASSDSSDESSGATRQSAFAGVMAAVGLMAFAF